METARLTLHPIGPQDRDTVLDLQTDPANFTHEQPNSRRGAQELFDRWSRHWAAHGWGYWLARRTGTGELVGIGGATSGTALGQDSINVYYRLVPSARGHGYAAELLGPALDHAERVGPPAPMVVITDPDNAASLALAAKFGFHEYHRGTHRGLPSVFLRRLTTRTERLVLREPLDGDLDALLAVEGDPRTTALRVGGPADRATAAAWLAEWRADWRELGYGYWHAVLAETGQSIGFGGVRPVDEDGTRVLNVYYRLTPSAWGQGYATELASAALDLAGTSGLPVSLITADRNAAAVRVAEKLGLAEVRPRAEHAGVRSRFYGRVG